MGFTTRLSNGWTLTKTSLKIIKENKTLLFFPILSTTSLILILVSFFYGLFSFGGESFWEALANEQVSEAMLYLIVFAFYLINYFIIIFFNAALIHCAIKILNDEKTSLGDGINFARSRIVRILMWSTVSATVGMILNVIQNSGKPGEIISAIIGFAWSIMTFFVLPIIIYEDKGVFESIKASIQLMKDKWGESLAANTSLGFFHLLGIILAILVSFLLGPILGGWSFAFGFAIICVVSAIFSAAKTIFVAAIYNKTEGKGTSYFDDEILDAAFILKH
jgi:hypothetical protein